MRGTNVMMFSFIVPVYKVEAYLARCIDSILNQKIVDFELILIDDGSPDRCGMICDQYAERDDRIKVIHQANGGLSDARNAGLKIALGRYICFVDSDDWIDVDYLIELSRCIKENPNIDMVIFGYRICGPDYEDIFSVPSDVSCLEVKSNLITDAWKNMVWYKCFRKEAIKDILFPKGLIYEDVIWGGKILKRIKSIILLDKVLYNYDTSNNSSITKQVSSLKIYHLYLGKKYSYIISKNNSFSCVDICLYNVLIIALECLKLNRADSLLNSIKVKKLERFLIDECQSSKLKNVKLSYKIYHDLSKYFFKIRKFKLCRIFFCKYIYSKFCYIKRGN